MLGLVCKNRINFRVNFTFVKCKNGKKVSKVFQKWGNKDFLLR